MAVLDRATLEIDADVDQDGTTENGVFEMAGDIQITEETNPSYLIGGRGSTINAILGDIIQDQAGRRRQIYVDVGAGSHLFEIQFLGWKGAIDSAGNELTWGDSSETKGTIANATGQGPQEQINVFHRYIKFARMGSVFEDVRLKIGMYNPTTSANWPDYLTVALERPRHTAAAEEFEQYDGSITCVEVQPVSGTIDAVNRLEY